VNRSYLLPVAYLADQIAGDPEWFPHPVRLMGFAIAKGETLLRRPGQSRDSEIVAGAALTVTVVATSYFLTRRIIGETYRCSKLLGLITEIALGWTCLAARSLRDEAAEVLAALDADDISRARRRLARIVGRDTENLEAPEISRAVIETLAESGCDGIVAPLFYMSVGGVPLAMAYKAVNTLDSMIGHTDDRYFYFGKPAARLDDAANFLPARMTALAIVGASKLSAFNDCSAKKIWLRDGNKHKSPNAGQPESAMSGALGVQLGGGNFYGGEFISAEQIGKEFPQPQPRDARKAIRITSTVSLLGLGAGLLLGALFRSMRNR
jgi:adenosylcobinamide-phosphate synthase